MSVDELLYAWRELDEACPAYVEAEAFFEGTRGEVFATRAVQVLLRQVEELKRFNFARIPVTTLADRLTLTGMQVPENDPLNARIKEIWDANDCDVWMPIAVLRALIYGDSYVMAWPVASEDPVEGSVDGAVDDQLLATNAELTVWFPHNCRVMYDLRSGKHKEYALTRWPITTPDGKAWRADLYYRDVIEEWWCPPGMSPTEPASWQPHTGQAPDALERPDGFDGMVENPYGEIPFFHLATDRPYGRPVHAEAYGPQDGINKMIAMQMATADSQGWPDRFALLDPEAALNAGGTHPGFDDDADLAATSPARLAGLTGPSRGNLSGGPASMKWLEGVKEYGQLPPADPKVFLEPAEMFVRMMAQLTTIPLHYFDPSGDVPSGESLKTAEAPLVKWAGRLQRLFRTPLSELWRFLLLVVGERTDSVVPVWEPVTSAVGASDWEVVKAKQDAGVPQEHTLVEAGYAPEDVQQWLDDSTDAMDLQRRITLLQAVADAIQKMGGAVATGFLDKESAVQALNSMWPELALEEGDDPEPPALPPGPGQPPARPGQESRSSTPKKAVST